MRRSVDPTTEHDKAIAVELAIAEKALHRALSLTAGPRRASFGDFNIRREVSRTQRDIERCIDSIRKVHLIGDLTQPTPKPAEVPK